MWKEGRRRDCSKSMPALTYILCGGTQPPWHYVLEQVIVYIALLQYWSARQGLVLTGLGLLPLLQRAGLPDWPVST